MMVILKVESKGYKHVQVLLSLNMTVTFIRAVENVRLVKNEDCQTHIFNGSNQRTRHVSLQQRIY